MLKSTTKSLVYRYLPMMKTIFEIDKKKHREIKKIINKYGLKDNFFNYSEEYELIETHYDDRNFEINDSDIINESKKVALINSNKNYPLTVKENVKILDKYLKLLDDHRLKTIILVNPQNEYYRNNFSSNLKFEFQNIIKNLQRKYSFQLLDLYDSLEFNLQDFIDGHNLNYKGNTKLTKLLNNYIEWDNIK